jgi:hypothetical protein
MPHDDDDAGCGVVRAEDVDVLVVRGDCSHFSLADVEKADWADLSGRIGVGNQQGIEEGSLTVFMGIERSWLAVSRYTGCCINSECVSSGHSSCSTPFNTKTILQQPTEIQSDSTDKNI